MSDTQVKRRIQAQNSASDPHIMGFVLDAIVQPGPPVRFEGADDDAPLSQALFAIAGIHHVEVSAAAIWVRKEEAAEWSTLKPAIAAAIRRVLDATDMPLGTQTPDTEADAVLLREVEQLLELKVNPSVASHGGHIGADRVENGTVYLRMSGGCQGCAASSATLREGVEHMLREALPQIREIVDVTDHEAGSSPFYEREDKPSPALNRPVPRDVIGWQDGEIVIDPEYLAPRLGLTPEALQTGLGLGDVVATTEIGKGVEAGKTRIILRSTTRAWAAEVFTDGTAREIPPPREIPAGGEERDTVLASQARAHLERLPNDAPHITYGALARALGYFAPGSLGRITRALEVTMREDAASGAPFIAARAVSRGAEQISARGFFDLAAALGAGPEAGESDQEFHAREIARLGQIPKGTR